MLPHLVYHSRILIKLGKLPSNFVQCCKERYFHNLPRWGKGHRMEKSPSNTMSRSFQAGPSKEKGLVIYNEANANKQLLRYGRLGIGVQLVALLIGAETVHAVRTQDEIEKEVNPNIHVNMYTGKFGFAMVPGILCLACAFTVGGYFFFGRIVKKILYVPSNGRVTFITHHLFGGENIKTTTLGNIKTQHTFCQVDGYSWRFVLANGAEIPNKQMFNLVMGSSGANF